MLIQNLVKERLAPCIAARSERIFFFFSRTEEKRKTKEARRGEGATCLSRGRARLSSRDTAVGRKRSRTRWRTSSAARHPACWGNASLARTRIVAVVAPSSGGSLTFHPRRGDSAKMPIKVSKRRQAHTFFRANWKGSCRGFQFLVCTRTRTSRPVGDAAPCDIHPLPPWPHPGLLLPLSNFGSSHARRPLADKRRNVGILCLQTETFGFRSCCLPHII